MSTKNSISICFIAGGDFTAYVYELPAKNLLKNQIFINISSSEAPQ